MFNENYQFIKKKKIQANKEKFLALKLKIH